MSENNNTNKTDNLPVINYSRIEVRRRIDFSERWRVFSGAIAMICCALVLLLLLLLLLLPLLLLCHFATGGNLTEVLIAAAE